MKTDYDKKDLYLYSHMPKVGNALMTLDEKIPESRYVFSSKFDESMASILNSDCAKKGNSKNVKRICSSKVAAAIMALFVIVGGIGITVNAATDGNLIAVIREICFGKTDGATSQFYYGSFTSNDALTLDDFPEGTILTEVIYQGDGIYILQDGTEISVNRIVFINLSEETEIGDILTVYILPE